MNSPISPISPISPNTPSSPKFCVSSVKIFITIPTHIGKDYIDFIHSLYPIKEWIYCNEQGDSDDGYEHSHIAITFVKKVKLTNARVFDFNNQHPRIESCKKWPAAVTYCMKEGKYTANFDVTKFQGISALVDKIVESKSAIEAVKSCANSLKEVIPIITIYNNKGYVMDEELKNELLNAEFRPWQATLFDMMLNENDRRKIHWVCETTGNTGKSYFCDIMEVKYMHECIIIAATGSLRDIADVIRNWMDQGNVPRYVLIDLPRTYEDRDSIYTILESLKNGRLTCTKYKGTTLRFKSPVVCVFSNFSPDLSKCSLDRWDLHTICNNELSPLPRNIMGKGSDCKFDD